MMPEIEEGALCSNADVWDFTKSALVQGKLSLKLWE